MKKLLCIQASPRIGRSASIAVAEHFIEIYRAELAWGSDWYMNRGKWYAKEPEKDYSLSKLIADIRTATSRYQDLE